MELSANNSTLFLAILLSGLAAGLCFTWTNAVTPGIGKLNDLGYLSAFQQMNRSILNPLFFLVFFGPLFAGIAAVYTNKGVTPIFWLILAAATLYFLGVALVTIFGNVPLNEMLDNTDLTNITLEDTRSLRSKFESRWNRLHLIRTLSSVLSFGLLLLASFLK